jgi:acetyl-CoA C-acetyltransferase
MIHDGLLCAFDKEVMGKQADATNRELGIGRQEQDEYACMSHRRAADAADAGRFEEEIVSIDLADGTIHGDEGIRRDTSIESLSGLNPAFSDGGTVTAGNASQLSDAGIAGVVASRQAAADAGLAPIAQIMDYAVIAGPDPSLHLKPARAAKELLRRHGLRAADIDLWEINEAFAAVVIASVEDLAIDVTKVNVNGGAIALGHPFGASGLRIVLALGREMKRIGAEFGIAAICGGGGQGQAVLLCAAA